MPHRAAFHQDLHCCPKIKTVFRGKNTPFYRYFDPIIYKNGQFHAYCINMYGIIHQNEKFLNPNSNALANVTQHLIR